MSAMSITGPTAASAAVSSAIASAAVRAAHHALMIPSSSSRAAARPSNVTKRASSPTPSTTITRRAMLLLLVDTAIQRPSAQRYVPRGTVYGRPGAEPRLQPALQRVHRRQRAHQVQHRLQQVDVDDLAAAAVQGDHRGERRGEPRRLVGQRHRRQQRLAVRLAVDGGEPAHRLGDRREPGPPGVRAVLAEPRDARDDEPRVAGVQHVGAEPELLQPPGPEVLDEHRCVGDEAEQDVAVGVVLEVEDDRALAAVGELEPQPLAVALVAPRHRAQAVAVGALDLDHVGAEVGEVAGAVGAGDHRRQVEHADVGERERGRHGSDGVDDHGHRVSARSWAA